MSTWVETTSPNFSARHPYEDLDDVTGVLELLEGTRERYAEHFPRLPGSTAVVVHPSSASLGLAHPLYATLRAISTRSARRYLAGWCTADEVHVLAPRVLERSSSAVPGSREMAMLSPAALYTQIVVATNNAGMPPPVRPGSLRTAMRWSWLIAGAGQFLSGQTEHARAAIARRLHEGRKPSFPPGLRDASLLGGSVFDLLARERGMGAVISLACTPANRSPARALTTAFDGRAPIHIEGAWRAHLARLAGLAG